MTIQQLCDVIEDALSEALAEDDFDLSIDEGNSEATIEADEWTLQLTANAGELTGFLAIDDEPENETGYAAAWRAALGPTVIAALADADRQLSGALSAALLLSGDPFSGAFAEALRAA
jgi:hypothetical protein